MFQKFLWRSRSMFFHTSWGKQSDNLLPYNLYAQIFTLHMNDNFSSTFVNKRFRTKGEDFGSDGLVHPVHWWEAWGHEQLDCIFNCIFISGNLHCTVTIQLTQLLLFRNTNSFRSPYNALYTCIYGLRKYVVTIFGNRELEHSTSSAETLKILLTRPVNCF